MFSSAVFAGAGMRHACFLPSQILKLVRSEKLVLPFSSRGLCLFLKNHFRQHRSLPSSSLQGKAHEKMNVLHGGGSRPPFLQDSSTPFLRGDSRGCFEMFEGEKKKSTHPSLRPQYSSANVHQWSMSLFSFHPAKKPRKHLKLGKD